MIRALVCAFGMSAGMSEAACRQALALGLDVSGSVDDAEYALQRDGLAAALLRPAVSDVLLAAGSAPVRISIFEWSGPNDQTLILPWTAIDDAQILQAVTQTITSHKRAAAAPTTAIGAAMTYGLALLEQQPDCWQHTLDLSGDGPANTGKRPHTIRLTDDQQSMVINGLVIGADNASDDDDRAADIKELSSYYKTAVIRGPGAFVEVALGFQDYANAMERKLLRELQSIAIGRSD